MLYWLLVPLKDLWGGFNVFRYITFRTAMATLSAFVVVIVAMPLLMRYFQRRSLFENIDRSDTPQLQPHQADKKNTPSMGGIIIVGAVVLSTFVWADLGNHFTWVQMFTMASLGLLGFIDDYIKINKLNKKRGLGVFQKLGWETLIACTCGAILYIDPGFEKYIEMPFLKFALINLGIFYLLFAVLVLLVSANAVNITDGLDGLAAGSMAIVATTFVVLSYVTGHMKLAHYLNIFYLKEAGELAVFCGALAGACLGFLWFNCYPAQVFMGDTGSLALGGSIGITALLIKKELLLGLIGGIFLVEFATDLIQIFSFRLFGRRVFRMAPLHHHFQLQGLKESKITVRFWIFGILCAVLSIITLKIR